VKVHGPLPEDYTKLGLTTASVQIDYGDPAGGTKHVNKGYGFNARDAEPIKTFSNPMYAGHYDFRYRTTYTFDASWTGDPAERVLEEASSSIREVHVLPQRDFKFVTINAAFPSAPDWTTVSQIHLYLTCSSLSARWPESFDRTAVIHEGWAPSLAPPEASGAGPVPALPWKVRFKDADLKTPVRIAYRAKYVMRDGTEREVAPRDTNDPTLVLAAAPPRA
jgi:hypothetical protein